MSRSRTVERASRWPSIPDPALMAETGRRVANSHKTYREIRQPKYEAEIPDQPQRIDLEMQATPAPEHPVPSVEIFFPSP